MRNSSSRARQYFFSQVPSTSVPRCKLRRPTFHKTTINCDYLYPLYWDEVLPGDTFKIDVSCVARMTTLLAPIMDNLTMDWQFFFVPNRLLWKDWQRFCGEKETPDTSTNILIPHVTVSDGGISAMTIGDYLGLPLGVKWRDHDVNCLPFRAYQLIWNQWYRDEHTQDSVDVKLDDTVQNISAFSLLKRGKRKDYYTSCSPEPQDGPAITLPVGEKASVYGNGKNIGLTDGTTKFTIADRAAGASQAHVASLAVDGYGHDVGTNRGDSFVSSGKSVGVVEKSLTDTPNESGMYADLSSVEGVSINTLRQAFALQRMLEMRERGGNRYIEILRSFFGVISPDARLQRAEFLGSFSIPVNIHTVTQTSESATTPQGTLSGVGTINGVNRVFTKSFLEHGIIMGLCSVRGDLSYQQGIPRKFSRSNIYDIYWTPLANLGEQAVLNKEIYAQGTSTDDEAFGYQERWSEYKYGQSLVTGQLRSTYSAPLDFWHLAQHFESLPTLNSDFISENVPLDRALALDSATAPQFIVDCFFDVLCARPMPLYDVPGLSGSHF